ncbi:MED11 polymerase, partial [Polypterus senegalus]
MEWNSVRFFMVAGVPILPPTPKFFPADWRAYMQGWMQSNVIPRMEQLQALWVLLTLVQDQINMANDRLRALEEVEKEIGTVLQCAGNIILELSKEKHNASFLDRQLSQFTTSVNRVETELSNQIRYLTQVATGQPHEGSTYSARKDCQMALNRVDYARVKLGELGRTCEILLDTQT